MELYIDNKLIDLDSNVAFPLTFQISDIRSIENRKGNNSKTIALPGTRNNCAIMASVFSLTATDGTTSFDTFDPSVKASARYYRNGVLEFQGICQLIDCVDNNGVWTFNIVLFSDYVDIFSELKNIKLKELGWSEYNHNLTLTNQQNSWSGTIQKNGSPYNNYSGVNWIGEGYYYGLIDYGYDRPSANSFTVDQIAPQVFVKTILDKMFSSIDVTVESTFFDSEQFKRILLAWEGGEIPLVDSASATALSIETDQLLDTISSTSSFGFVSSDRWASNQNSFIFYNANSGTAVDPSSQIQQYSGLKFVASSEGVYKLTLSGSHDIDITIGSGVETINGRFVVTCVAQVLKNGSVYENINLYQQVTETTSNNTTYTASFNINTNYFLDPSDQIEVLFRWNKVYTLSTEFNAPTSTTTIDVNATELDLTYQVQGIVPGGIVDLTQYMPDMTCATFLKGIISAFNLYVQPNPDDPKTVRIEPLASFYNGSNNAVNWSALVDRSKERRITPTVNFATAQYIWSYEDDKDYWNDRYTQDVTKQYGSKTVLSPSQFATGVTEFKLPFSNKVLGEIPDTDLIVPRNFTVKSVDGLPEIVPKKGKPFLVQIKKGNVGTLQSGSWYHIDEFDVASSESNYPYVGHLDDINNPTFDLMFNIPSYVFYDIPAGINYTTNNLYLYHERFIRELVNKHGKMLTCYLNLNSSLINTLDFRNLINIDGVVYRLNKVDNYDSSNDESTKCEFIKILEGESVQTYTIDNVPSDSTTYAEPSKKKSRITEDNIDRATEDSDTRRIE